MIKIRKKVFETNSSSTHSFTYAERLKKHFFTNEEIKEILSASCDEENKVLIKLGQYGWKFSVVQKITDKISYLITKEIYSKELTEKDIFNNKLFLEIEEWIKQFDFSGIKIEFPEYFFVDHQSAYNENKFPDNSLDQFLRTNEYVVVTGNDNVTEEKEMEELYKLGII